MTRNIPLAPVLGLAGGLALPALNGWNKASGSAMTKLSATVDQVGQGIYGYSVINKRWATNNLPQFWAPVAGGSIAHIAANKLGINRILAHAKLGFTI